MQIGTPTLIILSGLPGAGKTTLGRALARAIGAVHVRIDSIEQAIRAWGAVNDLEDVGYRVGYALALDNLRLGLVVVADSVNPWGLTRQAWRAVARDPGGASFDLEVICSDAAEHRRRVETRPSDIQGHINPTWQEVSDRDYQPWDHERLVIDTAERSVEACIAEIEAALARS
jgi:predicted kinase